MECPAAFTALRHSLPSRRGSTLKTRLNLTACLCWSNSNMSRKILLLLLLLLILVKLLFLSLVERPYYDCWNINFLVL